MCDFKDLGRIVEETQGRLLRYAEQFLHDRAGAQDAVQDAYVRYIRRRREETGGRIVNLSSWLFKTTRNICLDVLKSSRKKTEVPMDGEEFPDAFSSFPGPDSQARANDDARLLRELISGLSAREQEILSLKFEQSKRYDEIAEIMNLGTGNVGFLLHGAIEKLKKAYRARETGGAL